MIDLGLFSVYLPLDSDDTPVVFSLHARPGCVYRLPEGLSALSEIPLSTILSDAGRVVPALGKGASLQTAPPISLTTQPVSLLLTLREETLDLHERLETRLDIVSRLVSADSYRTLLSRFYGFYAPLEEILAVPERAASWAALDIDFEERRKSALLVSDLQVLGLTSVDLSRLAKCPISLLPVPTSTAELVGCTYVLEGSTLGGQVIGRLLVGALGLEPGEPGARFFYGYGARTGILWQQFRRAAEEFAAHENAVGSGVLSVEQAVAAARRTFASMEAWLVPEEAHCPRERQP